MDETLGAFERRLFSTEGKAHFASLPPVFADFWKAGEANIALIRAGKKDEAFAFLVDTTIPVRNHLLAELATGEKIQAEGLGKDIGRIERDVLNTSSLILGSALGIAVALLVVSTYVARVLRHRVEMSRRVAERVRDGDLTVAVPPGANDEFGPLLQAMDAMQTSLTRVVSDVRQSADSVASASAQIALGNADLSSRTERQASALEEASASMEQMGSTASQNADNARQASQLAASASTVAVQGGDVVGQVVQTMSEIVGSVRRVSDIIGRSMWG